MLQIYAAHCKFHLEGGKENITLGNNGTANKHTTTDHSLRDSARISAMPIRDC
jgi:hypothetical protein